MPRLNSTNLVPLRVDVELPPEPEQPSPILSSSRRTRIPNRAEAIGRKFAILLPDDSQESLEEDQILGNPTSNDPKQGGVIHLHFFRIGGKYSRNLFFGGFKITFSELLNFVCFWFISLILTTYIFIK